MVHVPPAGSASPITSSSPIDAAPPAPSTAPGAPAAAPSTTIAPGLAATAPAAATGDPSGSKRVRSLAKQAKEAGEKVVDVITKPTNTTSTTVSYKIAPRVLKPGESLYFAVPEALRDKPVNFVILGHKGDASLDTDPDKSDKWDDTPALASVQVHARDLPEEKAWRYWKGSASGAKGSKFAEVGYGVELENLYEWRKIGHGAVSDDSFSKAALHPDAIRVVSMGEDPVTISEVTLKVTPAKPDLTLEAVFSEGTKIGDPETGEGRAYGGGQGHQGTFPGALELRGWGSSGGAGAAKLPEGWKLVNGALEIPLVPGKRITAVEVACGDSHPDKITNADGGWGTKGWSKLSIGLKKASGSSIEYLMQSENVPPEGVLGGGPKDGKYVTKAGDKIVISASSDTTYVMAARVGLKNP